MVDVDAVTKLLQSLPSPALAPAQTATKTPSHQLDIFSTLRETRCKLPTQVLLDLASVCAEVISRRIDQDGHPCELALAGQCLHEPSKRVIF
jgi:hypothetical protein